jgi:hypothetical protein
MSNHSLIMAKERKGNFWISFMKGMCLICSMMVSYPAFGQKCAFFKYPDNRASFIIAIIQDSLYQQMQDTVLKVQTTSRTSFLLLDGTQIASAAVKDTINSILNSEEQINLKNVHLLILGNKAFFDQYSTCASSIFASKCYIQTDYREFDDTTYMAASFSTMNFSHIVTQMNKSQHWDIEIDNIKESSLRKPSKNRTPFGLGLGFSEMFLSEHRALYDIPNTLRSFDIRLSKELDDKYKLSAMLSFNIPSKKNMGSMESSFSDNDYNVMGATIFSWAVDFDRYVLTYGTLRIYTGLGITKTNLMVMYVKSSGGSGFKPQMYSYGSLSANSGAEFHFSKVIFDLRTSLNFSLNTGTIINSFNLSLGISYQFQRKQPVNYDYIRL